MDKYRADLLMSTHFKEMEMLRVSLLVCFLIALNSCDSEDKGSGSTFEGVDSSGGGNSTVAEMASEDDLHQLFIQEARESSWQYFVSLSQSGDFPQRSRVHPQILKAQKIILQSDLIEFQSENQKPYKGCYDSAGNRKDASIYASSPHRICVDVTRIAQKGIAKPLAGFTASSLLIHEVSHHLGFDESEALQFEKYFAEHPIVFKDAQAQRKNIRSLALSTDVLSQGLHHYSKTLISNRTDIDDLYTSVSCEQLTFLLDKVRQFRSAMFNQEEQEILNDTKISMQLEISYLCGSGKKHRTHYEALLDEQFKRYPYVTAGKRRPFTPYLSHWSDADFVDAVVKKYNLIFNRAHIYMESLYSCDNGKYFLGRVCQPPSHRSDFPLEPGIFNVQKVISQD